jgi:hypothetical protein
MPNKISECVNSIFEQPWWLDIVAPNQWIELLVKEGDVIKARWPIVKKWYGIGMPILTQSLGFWISEDKLDADIYYNEQKRITNLLLEQLPRNRNIKIRLSPNVQYFLPIYWKSYKITPLVIYRINDISDVTSIYNRFNRIVKGNIRSASKKCTVKEIDDIGILIMLMEKTFGIQRRKFPISKDLIINIYNECTKYKAGKLLYALDPQGFVHSGALLVYDKNVCYALMGGTDPKYRSSGVFSLVLWESIKFASTVSKSFDFQGSMIEGVENFLRQFGGKPIVYYQIRKQNILLELFELLKPRIKSIIGYKQ